MILRSLLVHMSISLSSLLFMANLHALEIMDIESCLHEEIIASTEACGGAYMVRMHLHCSGSLSTAFKIQELSCEDVRIRVEAQLRLSPPRRVLTPTRDLTPSSIGRAWMYRYRNSIGSEVEVRFTLEKAGPRLDAD